MSSGPFDTVELPDGFTEALEAVDAARISSMIEELAEIGADELGGVSRLAYTSEEREAHQLVASWLEDQGMKVRADEAGNLIAERPGTDPRLPALAVGSHLDSVYHGGAYDGAAGVVAAVEIARLLATSEGAELRHPYRVVAFAAEEGARFGEPCIGSKLATGILGKSDLDRLTDREGTSVREAMRGVGLNPDGLEQAVWPASDWAGFLELHVEQAEVLEREQLPVGLVDMVSGSTRLELTLLGRAAHTGGTPMAYRSDALVAAAEVVLAAEQVATDPRHRGTRATVGRLEVHPNSITTIPGAVRMSVDVRDVDSDRQRETAVEIVERAQEMCARRGVQLTWELLSDSSPVVLPMWLRQLLQRAAQRLGVSYRVMTSGASHDAQVIGGQIPTGMVFVPSRDGLSHVPGEWTSASHLAIGIQVLLSGLFHLDSFLGRSLAADGPDA